MNNVLFLNATIKFSMTAWLVVEFTTSVNLDTLLPYLLKHNMIGFSFTTRVKWSFSEVAVLCK